jgi:uncharacterized DUF497 family protein
MAKFFEWDENKNRLNFENHGIAFSVAVKIFENSHLVYESPRGAEMRYVAVGEVAEKLIAVIYTLRYEKIRIISARRAWKKEERAYRELFYRHASGAD